MKWNDGLDNVRWRLEPQKEWEDTEFECPECGGVMQINTRIVLASNPPQREYRCRDCRKIRTRYE